LLPMVFSSGAGSVSRESLGTAVNGGMMATTFLSLAIVPVLYILINQVRESILNRFKVDRSRSSATEPVDVNAK
jgi:hydrophobic/amphiphilic exporter-1 (mainly G- bacteria), HAE1 family